MSKERKIKISLIVSAAIVILLFSVLGYLYKTGNFNFSAFTDKIASYFSGEITQAPSHENKVSREDEVEVIVSSAYVPDFMMGTKIITNETFDLSNGKNDLQAQLKSFSVYLKGMNINSCVFTDTGDDALNSVITEFFKENGIYACIYCDVSANGEINDRVINEGISFIENKIKNVSPDAVLLGNYANTKTEETTSDDKTLKENTDKYLSILISAVRKNESDVAVGVLTGADKDIESDKHYFDVEAFFKKDIADFVIVEMPYTMNEADTYNSTLNYWNELLKDSKTSFFTELYNDKVLSGGNWTNPVEIVKQIIASTKYKNYRGFLLRDVKSLIDNKQASTSSLVKYINEDLSAEVVLKELTIKYPTQRVMTTNEESIMFQGTTDINYAVTINGTVAARNDAGDFACPVKLKVGANRIVFEHKGKTIVYTITRMVNVLTDVSPTGYATFDGKTTVSLSAVAYKDAKVTATLNGKTVALRADYGSTTGSDTLYCAFYGSITLPASTSTSVNLGQILFYANYQGITGSKYGASIVVNKVSVGGATQLLTVKNENLPFTYNSESTHYFPCPDQVYLPAGTMDYVVGEQFTIKDGNTVYTFVKTASGKRFQTKDVSLSPFKDLGDNTIKSVLCTDNATTVSFDFEMTWNVPFNIQTDGVNYSKINYEDFKVVKYNPTSLVISFDYTTDAPEIEIPENSLFSSYNWEKKKNGDDNVYELTLGLKRGKSGTGYTAKYIGGHLIISFTKPLTATIGENEYGYSLAGQVIAISAGHGGIDSGAWRTHGGKVYQESDLNVAIVNKLKTELEKAGATVIICNDIGSDNKPDYRARSKRASDAGAQIHIVVHQNSVANASAATGFECWYYNPYSYTLGEYLQKGMEEFYKNTLYGSQYTTEMDRGRDQGKGNGFFSWISDTVYPDSPTVLIETGYISNEKYCLAMQNENYQIELAKELTKGIINYANS